MESYRCECLDCGHVTDSEQHCRESECPECGGQMRRVERPGAGAEEAEGMEQEDAQEATTKTVDGEQYPASDFLVVEDPEKPTTWHLQVKRHGKPDANLMGSAWAALTSNNRGNPYQGPDKEKALKKLTALYHSQDKKTPGEREAERQEHESHSFEATVKPAKTSAMFEGREWDVTLIGPDGGGLVQAGGRELLRSKNKRLYSIEALRDSAKAGMWEGIKVYDNHLSDAEFEAKQGMRSVANEWVGTIVGVTWQESARKLTGRLKIVDEALAKKLKAAYEAGVLDSVGLSIDTVPGDTGEAVIEGEKLPVIESFRHIFSVDVVSNPAAGGGFDRLIAAVQPEEVEQMDEKELQELAQTLAPLVAEALAATEAEEIEVAQTLAPLVAEALAATEAEEIEEEESVAEGEPEVEEVESPEVEPEEVEAEAEEEEAGEPEAQAEEAEDVSQKVRKLECRLMLRDKMDAAKLSDPSRRVLEAAFGGKVFEEAELDKVIKRLKEAEAAADASGRVTGAGGELTPTMTGDEKAEIALLDLLAGSNKMRKLESIEADFVDERKTEAFDAWVKAGRPNYRTRRISDWLYEYWGGNPLIDRAREGVTTASVTTIVKNTVNLLLAADYSERRRWFEQIATVEEVDTIDDITLGRVYGMDTLDTVSEGAAYTEMDWEDEEETASFVKRGNYVSITLETLLQDKLNIVRSIPRRLSNAWYNTQSSLVSAVFTTNTATGPVLADTGALFNATATSSTGGHANLLTTALDFDAYGAVRTAMMKQTDQTSGSGQKLLIQPRYVLVPVDLETTALQIRNSEYEPASMDNDVNPYYQSFEVVVVPEWTDTNNWAAVADPNEWPAIYLVYLRGLRTPELFEASNEQGGSMFTNDTIRYKVRLMTYRFSSTYDCAPVADFRPLHKSNV